MTSFRIRQAVALLASSILLAGVVAAPAGAAQAHPPGVFDGLLPEPVPALPPLGSLPGLSGWSPLERSLPVPVLPPSPVPAQPSVPVLPPLPGPSGPGLPLAGHAPGPVLPSPEPDDSRPGPGRAWTLIASKLTMRGSRYHGYSEQTVSGRRLATLRFTADRLEITNLVQRGDLGNGKIVEAASAPGRVSTVTDGPIELHVQRLSGNLVVAGYPVVPVTLSPGSVAMPNRDLGFLGFSELTFAGVVVGHNVALDGGTLSIPQARIRVR